MSYVLVEKNPSNLEVNVKDETSKNRMETVRFVVGPKFRPNRKNQSIKMTWIYEAGALAIIDSLNSSHDISRFIACANEPSIVEDSHQFCRISTNATHAYNRQVTSEKRK